MKLALLLTVATLLAASIAAQLDETRQVFIASTLTILLQVASIIRLLTFASDTDSAS